MNGFCPDKKPLVCVATSEATWTNLVRYCFNHSFKANRNRFDLAVVCNGVTEDASTYIKTFKPDYFLSRPNLGFDLAGFDALLRHVPSERYERFILLHDDHWFEDEDWLETLLQLADKNPDIDVFGNLLDCSTDKLVEHFEIVGRILGYGRYLEPMPPVFTQGVAGLFSRRAIEVWRQADGIPHIHNNLKNVAEICERLASFMLYANGCSFMQIPPGFQRYLRHGSHISHCLEAPQIFYRSPSGINAAASRLTPSDEAVRYFANVTHTSCSLKVALITSRLDVVSLLRTMPRHRLRQVCFYAVSPTVQAEASFHDLSLNLLIINSIAALEDIAAVIANMDYIITDLPEAALSAAAQHRPVIYLPASSQKDYAAADLASCAYATILPGVIELDESERNLIISLALLGRLVSEAETGLTVDERRVNHEISSRTGRCQKDNNVTASALLSLLDEETPLFQDIGIETTTICNMSCSYCPNSSVGRPAAYMAEETFHAIIDSVATSLPHYSGSISPHFYGEPLVDERLESLIRYARKRLPDASIQLFTNGTLLTVQRFCHLVEAGVDKLVISQHTPHPAPDLVATLQAIRRDYPDHAEIEYFDQFHSNLKMNRGGLLASGQGKQQQFYRCNQYKALIFDVTGTAVLCCNDYLSGTTFGNIQHASALDIWNSYSYRRIRNLLYYSYFPLPICRNCAFLLS